MGEMAVKISKVNQEELLNLLQSAYAEEWLAYYQYWIGAKVAEGIKSSTVIEEFKEHADEELKHADWLAERIIQLGGTPLLNPNDWEKYAKCKYDAPHIPDTKVLVNQNLIAERCAVGKYQQICEFCQGKDYETFRISRKILKEELEHEQEMQDLINDFKYY